MNWTPFDVAWMGTSLTNRLVSGYWLDALEAQLRQETSRPIRFYDMGWPGDRAVQGVAKVGMAANLRPAVAVIEYGMNDATEQTPIESFRNSLEAIVDTLRVRSPSTKLLMMTMNPAISPAPPSSQTVGTYYAEVRAVAQATGVLVIDNEPVWGSPTNVEIPDGVHPTGAANLQTTVPTALAALLPLAH